MANRAGPIELESVVAAGRTSDGRLFVVDESGGEQRVFASDGDALQRLRTRGSGSQSAAGGAFDHTIMFEETGIMRRIVIRIRNYEVTGLALARADERTFFDQLGADGEQLTIVAPTRLEGISVRNLPGEILIEYFASVADGRRLLVTRPRDDWDYESFRVYFGVPPLLAEQPVESVTRAKDGGSTHVVFSAAGEKLDAYFPAPLSMPGRSATLQGANATWPLEREEPAAALLDGLRFSCL